MVRPTVVPRLRAGELDLAVLYEFPGTRPRRRRLGAGLRSVRLLEDVGAEAAAAITAEAERLREWIGPTVKITPRFRTPLERELSGFPA